MTGLGQPDVLDSREAGGKVIRGGSLRALAYAGGMIVGLVSSPLMIRHLGVRRFGEYQTVTALIFVAAGIVEGGLGNLGGREYATRDERGRRALVQDLLGLRLVLTTIAVIGAMGFALAAGYDRRLVAGTLLAGAGLYASTLQVTLLVPLVAQLRIGWVAFLDFLNQAVLAALIITLVAVGGALLPFFAAAGVAAAVTLVTTAYALRGSDVPLRPRFHRAAWAELLRETALYAAALALATVYPKVAILSMTLLSDQVQTGLYALPLRVIDLINYVPWLLAATAFPLMARAATREPDRLRYAQQRTFEVMVIVGALTWLALATGAPFVVDLFGGHKFHGSISVLRIISAAAPFTFLAANWSFALLSLRAYRVLLLVNGLVLALAVVLSAVLIPSLGADGGALVNIGVEGTLAVGFAIGLMRTRPELRPELRVVPRVLLAVGLGAAAGFPLPAPAIVRPVVATAICLTVLFVLGVIPDELRDALRRRRPEPRR